MSELKNVDTFRESIDKLNGLWDKDKKLLDKEHAAALEAIDKGNGKLRDKYQADRDAARDRGDLDGAEIADGHLAKVAEKWQGERDTENKQYEEKVQAVDREYGGSVALIEEGLAAISKMEQRHERVDEACDQLMNQVENRPDVSAEQRIGDWVRAVGPPAEAAINTVLGTDIKIDWELAGNATEIAAGVAKIKYDLPLYSQNEFDKLLVDSVQQSQKTEVSQKNYEYVARLDALADQIQTRLEPYLGPSPDR
jgi:hypothetical protein